MGLAMTENCDQSISFFGRVIEQDSVIRAPYANGQVMKAAKVTSTDIRFRHVMTSRKNSIPNSREINLDSFRSYIDQDNVKPCLPRLEHHTKIILSGEGSLDGETLNSLKMLVRSC